MLHINISSYDKISYLNYVIGALGNWDQAFLKTFIFNFIIGNWHFFLTKIYLLLLLILSD